MRCLKIGTFRAIGDEAVHKLIALATHVEDASKTNRKTRAWPERPSSKVPLGGVTPDQLPSVLHGPLIVRHLACEYIAGSRLITKACLLPISWPSTFNVSYKY